MPKPYLHIVQVVIDGRLHGQQCENVLDFGTSVTPMPSLTTFLADLASKITTSLKPAVSDQWSLARLAARELFPTLGDEVEYVPSPPITGSGLPALPSFNCAIVAKLTGQGGRKKRGRFFGAGVIGNDVQSGQFVDNGLAKWQAWADALKANYTVHEGSAPDWELVVLSRTAAALPGGTIETASTPVVNLVARRIVGVLHRRKIGVGS